MTDIADGLTRLDADDVRALGYDGAVAALRSALQGGLDPEADVPRTIVGLEHGQGMVMPSEGRDWFGVKLITVAPGNPAVGRPRIQGIYLVHDAATLTPTAILDGVALTSLRTPAVAVAPALDRLRALAEQGPLRLVVFGAGPQGEGHAECVRAHVPVASVTLVTRSTGPVPSWADERVTSDDARLPGLVQGADVVVAATTARTPVVSDEDVADHAVVIACGSHEADARELPAALLGRSEVVVEARSTALREAGDVIMAVAEGALQEQDLISMQEAVRRPAVEAADVPRRPLVVKTTGMSWEDLAVAVAVLEHSRTQG